MFRLIAAGALLAAAIPSAEATPRMGSTEYLLSACKRELPLEENVVCPVYIRAFVNGLNAVEARTSVRAVCVPETATTVQLTAVFVRWAEAHPDKWHISDSVGLMMALEDAYPCF